MATGTTRRCRPAGFWQRAAAWSLDAVPVGLLTLVLVGPWLPGAAGMLELRTDEALRGLAGAMADVVRAQFSGAAPSMRLLAPLLAATLQASAAITPALWALAGPVLLGFAVLAGAWHAGFEASRLQASPGKRLLGLSVAGLDDGRLPVPRAVLRQLAGALSWLTLNLGHALAAAGPRHQALHDRIAGARVVAGRPGMPWWARAWLALALVAPLLATGWLSWRLAARLQALLDHALFWG